MKTREDLINKLKIQFTDGDSGFASDLADFIIADRKMIVEPLIDLVDKWGIGYIGETEMAIQETLERAGVE